MPYDKSLDVEIFKETKELGDTCLSVGVYAYNQGENKLQITRQNKNRVDEWQFVKLGRLSKDEVQEIIPLIQSAVEKM